MKFHKLSERVPESEKEGDIFEIAHGNFFNKEFCYFTRVEKVNDKKILKNLNEKYKWGPLLSKRLRKVHQVGFETFWRKIDEKELMAFL